MAAESEHLIHASQDDEFSGPVSDDSECNGISIQATPETKSAQTQVIIPNKDASSQASSTFEQHLKAFLTEEVGIKLRTEFSSNDLASKLSALPELKLVLENALWRKELKSAHKKDLKTFVV